MKKQKVAFYGTWESPFTSDRIVSESIRLGQITLDNEQLYWLESLPSERGRTAIVRLNSNGSREILTPEPFNIRTRVHEYGGGAYCIANGTIYFSNFSDQRFYELRPEGTPHPLTSKKKLLYADGIKDVTRNRIICIREDQTNPSQEFLNTIVSIPLDTKDKNHSDCVLISGNDFYSSPRLSPDGNHLAWLTWNHPNMPWDGTELWTAEIQPDGILAHARQVAGGKEESIFQPEWSPDGILHFVSDRTGWWNLYRVCENLAEPLCPMKAEFGEPQWIFGQRLYGFESCSTIICAYTQKGIWYLARLDTTKKQLDTFHLPYTDFGNITVGQSDVFCTASSSSDPNSIVSISLDNQSLKVLRRSIDFTIGKTFISMPTALEYPSKDGCTAHAFYYPPHNEKFLAPENEQPPLIVKSHGGPTGACSAGFNLMIQYWTSRGFAVLDVNYGGSTGYGRAYRKRLNGQWGIVDVEDCISAVDFIIKEGMGDAKRIAITGGSAGGYTTLCALTFHDCFTAGSSYYGVSDLEALLRETHKFESRYLDQLIAPYADQKELYTQRSPIHFTDRLSCPLILFQGLEDKVVPPNQAKMMFDAAKAKGIPVAYISFEGEQHGFRKAENIKRVLDSELYFYSKIFNFTPSDSLDSVLIENLQ